MSRPTLRELVRDALRALGKDNLVLAVHDAMFPSASGEGFGRGTPYSRGGREFTALAVELGFTGMLLGPQGQTSPGNASPYDSTIFSRSVLSISFEELDDEWSEVVDVAALEAAHRRRPASDGRTHYAHAYRESHALLDAAFARLSTSSLPTVRRAFDAFKGDNRDWLDHDAEFEARGDARLAERYAFGQFLVHAQHERFRAEWASGDWKLFGDLQIGFSPCDRWGRERLFVDGYAMGAPPSRTEPEGQAWGYPVLDPEADEALAFLLARAGKMLREFDGVRIDHPHGLVCPWVYDARASDALVAVRQGARLADSPDLPDHPRLARFAIARSEQLDRTLARYADGWVTALDEAQVDRYAKGFDVLVAAARAAGRSVQDFICEVLSTEPYPLKRVLDRSGLGRFRVTQKADPRKVDDVYRSANAEPPDWVMVGTHDTPPLASVVERWRRESALAAHVEYLAYRLAPSGASRETFAKTLLEQPGAFTRAMFADLVGSPARNVMVFVSDLLGMRDVYNRPGVVDEVNWTLRVPDDFRSAYRANLERGDGFDVPGALAVALRALPEGSRHQGLIDALEDRRRDYA